MEISKVIELLSDCCDRHAFAIDQDFYEAVRIGKKAVTLLAYDKATRLDDDSLKLLLNAERPRYEPDPRD